MVGYGFVHSAVDAYSRLAYSEVLGNEQGVTTAAFWTRALSYFATLGITVEQVLTDNGACYRSRAFAAALGSVRHSRTRPYHPQTCGKVCEHLPRRSTTRSGPGKGVTEVSFVRFVDRVRCCAMARTGRTDLT